MRIVKEAEERRNEILDVAERLFVTKGFDNTSTNDILSEIGIARGTLYYHFKSKTDILDAIIERIGNQLIGKATEIYHQKDIPILERFSVMILALSVDGNLGQEVMEQVHKPQNALLHQKMQERLFTGIIPLITGLIEEGIEQGICHTDYPQEVAEMTFLYSLTAFDTLSNLGKEEKERKVIAFISNVEILLGMKHGSMQAVFFAIFEKKSV